MPAMFPDLVAVLASEQLPFAQRAGAMTALERLGQSGTNALVAFCKGSPPLTENALRLRTLIIAHQFSADFAAADVTNLLADVMNCAIEMAVGTLWTLGESLPLNAIPDVLSELRPPVRTSPRRRAASNVSAEQRFSGRLDNRADALSLLARDKRDGSAIRRLEVASTSLRIS